MDDLTRFKCELQARLKDAGWSTRGIFRAFVAFKVRDAFVRGEDAAAVAARIDAEAPLGMAE